MPDQRDALVAEIKKLCREGEELALRERLSLLSPQDQERVLADGQAGTGGSEGTPPSDAKQRAILKRKPDFSKEYQIWYSPALRVVEQLLPDRYLEFQTLYRPLKRPTTLDILHFGVADYIAGVRVTRGSGLDRELVFDPAQVGLSAFDRQLDILGTAAGRVTSHLVDLGRTLHGEILDDEIATARELLRAGHTRPAGVVAGVVLEGHLKKLIIDRKLPLKKKAMLTNMNDALREAAAYDVVTWRRVQALADIRNICAHKGEREPNLEEVQRLVDEVSDVVKTVF